MNIIKDLILNFNNVLGWKTNNKIIVFESDDWGSIRMPSKKRYKSLVKKGIKVDINNWYLDCLESYEDFQNLYSIIAKYKDKDENCPVFTLNTVMSNPNFNKIKDSNFELFFYDHFFNSYEYYYGSDFQLTWKEGIKNKFIKPQFHAREHLNVNLWLKDLRKGHKETLIAFDHEFFGHLTNTSSKNQNHYLAAYRTENLEELNFVKEITSSGLKIFEETFGFKSETFIACNYIWPKELENILYKDGVTLLQGQRGRFQPNPNKAGSGKIVRNYIGQKNSLGQIYTIRNVKFEPFENPNIDWVNCALKEIETAFFWNKPAIISTHRINYVGGIDIQHRDRNLKLLDELLRNILIKWPDVNFLSSDQLSLSINNNL